MTRLAVVGCGHLGRIHARLAAARESIDLVAVVDPFAEARDAVASDLGVQAYERVSDLKGMVDGVILAAPTNLHRSLGLEILEAGMHLLVEKPIAVNKAESDLLVAAAKASQRVLQVGHVERFNPALAAAGDKLQDPKYIDARRYSGYTFRSTDVGVVLDLMIHDLDIILSLVQSDVVDVEAMGVAVMGEHEDAANARLKFANGCVANLSASRISYERARQMQVWSPERFALLDFDSGTARVVEPHASLADGSFDDSALTADEKASIRDSLFRTHLPIEQFDAPEVNAIAEEQADFISAIETGQQPRVTGAAGRDAVALADRILASIESHAWDGHAGGRVGPHRIAGEPVVRGPHWHLSESVRANRREAG